MRATEERWRKLAPPQAVKPQRKALSAYIIEKEETRVIGLKKDHRCPFLTEKKLCALVSAYGDAVLSETCTDFPREVHVFSDHEEETLMPCCPAVIDIWEKEEPGFPNIRGKEEKLLFLVRKEILNLLERKNFSRKEALLAAFYILLDLKGQEKKPIPADVRDCFSEKNEKRTSEKPSGRCLSPDGRYGSGVQRDSQDLAVNYPGTRGFTGIFWIPCWSSQRPFPRGNGTRFWKKKWNNIFYRNGKNGMDSSGNS